MRQIKQWLEVKPLDTLFFRGGEPMVAGETHEAGSLIFPPVPETIVGALRTAILAQRGINPEHIKDGKSLRDLPYWGTPEKPGFGIAGPLLKACGVVLFPAPANWFYSQSKHRNTLIIHEAQPERAFTTVKLSKPHMLWVKNPPENLTPLSPHFWVNSRALENEGNFELKVVSILNDLTEKEGLAVSRDLLFKTEERVGIARDNFYRTTKTGHLYAARHLRLEERVSLLIGLNQKLCPSHLDSEGYFQLGGEGRIVWYKLLDEEAFQLPRGNKGRLLALSPLSYSRAKGKKLLDTPYASGKLLRVAGWDMKKGFHKPARSYFPAGAVFYTQKAPGLCELMPF